MKIFRGPICVRKSVIAFFFFFHIFSIAYSQQSKDLAAVKKDNKWGAINAEGKMVIPCIYDVMEITCSDLIAVKKDGKFGFINDENTVKIALQYDSVSGFYEHKAVVRKGNKFGFINEEGELIIDYKFDKADIFSEGLAGVKIDNLWGFCDSQGNIVIQPVYDEVHAFNGNYCIAEKDFLGVINKEGKEILPFEYYYPMFFLPNNKDKDIIIATKADVYKKFRRDYVFKLHDTTYSKITERNLSGIESYYDPKSRNLECETYNPTDYLIFYSRTYGEKEIPSYLAFPNERFPGEGVMNKEGKVVFCCYDRVRFLDQTHFVYANKGDFEKATVVDTNGRRMSINEYEYDEISMMRDNILIVRRNGKCGAVNLYGEQVIDFKYDDIYGYRNGTFLAKLSDKYYVINLDGYKSEPLPFYIYDCWFRKKVIIVNSNLKYGVLDYKGNVLFEPQFDKKIDFVHR